MAKYDGHPAQGCTKKQIEVFEALAVNEQPKPYVAKKTIQALIDKGLIERQPDKTVGYEYGTYIKIPQYSVPIQHHAAWCAWCSEQHARVDV